jgi:hypothetical protein
MSESSYEDWSATVDSRYVCRECGMRSLEVEDGGCLYCNGDRENRDIAVRAANKAAWDKFYREHPEFSR